MAMTVALIFVIGLSSIYTVYKINQREEAYCLETLGDCADDLAQEIKTDISRDTEQLGAIADVIAGYEDFESEGVYRILRSYEGSGNISHLEILFPDDTVMLETGERVEAGDELSFAEESVKGNHISTRGTDLLDGESAVVRNLVPIYADGEMKAMLSGVMLLDELPVRWRADIYDGKVANFVVDRSNGEFILDTWNDGFGNIWTEEKPQLKSGYDGSELKEDFKYGREGHIVFYSTSKEEYVYFYYAPVGVNTWMLALSVPESTVFKNAEKLRGLLYLFVGFEAVALIVYFIGMYFDTREKTREKQRQIDMISYLHDIEKLLFGAHLEKRNITIALQRIAEMTYAENVFFEIYDDGCEEKMYIWTKDPETGKYAGRRQMFLQDYFLDGKKSLVMKNLDALKRSSPEHYKVMKSLGLNNLVVVPVVGTGDELYGILGVLNVKRFERTEDLLRSVTLSFSMLCSNLRTHNIIKIMGETDTLTGLLNRNSFQKKLPEYKKQYQTSLACIYADANGLHELNNSKGHEAGDRMLQYVGTKMQEQFGQEHTYRIGGDEFLAFAIDEEESSVLKKVEEIGKALEKEGYHASIGVYWSMDVSSMNELVKEAEQKMYAEKRIYYQQNGHERRRRC